MRPVRLELENFLSHRSTVVRLADYPTVVILGENGAGKTSLVEAMGWALFGKGRGRGPDDFVSDGAMECRVVFEFELGNTSYRVERQRSLSGRGKSELRLSAAAWVAADWLEADGPLLDPGWATIGGATIAETQVAIEDLLRMGYDLWLATSFIGQGDADRFTELAPGERKQLLADLLDVGRYQGWSQTARDRARELAGEYEAGARRRDELGSQLERRVDVEEALGRAEQLLDFAQSDVQTKEQELAELHGQVADAREQAAAAKALKDRLTDMRARREQDAARSRHDVEEAVADIARARVSAADLEGEIAGARQSVQRATDLEEQAFNLRTEVDGAENDARINQQTAEENGEKAATHAASRDALSTQLHEAQEAADALEAGQGALCPTCGREFVDDEERTACLGKQQKKALDLVNAVGYQEREYEKAAALASHARERMAEHSKRAGALRLALSERERQASAAAAAEDRIPSLESALVEARARESKLVQQLPEMEALAAELRQATAQERGIERQLQDLAGVLERVGDLGRKLEVAERAATSARATVSACTGDVARARAAVEQLESLAAELAALLERSDETRARREAYEMAARVLGRDGIQALMVENAIPEIQDEANHVLERLTDARFRVTLETLRATKTSEIRETLDVVVFADGWQRPLEQLSGGERQCVDLALRIGLARLLARRAGTQIETLIMDEAFTALDVGHRQRTTELLHDLAGEFPWLIFITHLVELADAFPQQIRVERTADGSVIVEREAVPA